MPKMIKRLKRGLDKTVDRGYNKSMRSKQARVAAMERCGTLSRNVIIFHIVKEHKEKGEALYGVLTEIGKKFPHNNKPLSRQRVFQIYRNMEDLYGDTSETKTMP